MTDLSFSCFHKCRVSQWSLDFSVGNDTPGDLRRKLIKKMKLTLSLVRCRMCNLQGIFKFLGSDIVHMYFVNLVFARSFRMTFHMLNALYAEVIYMETVE